MLATLIATHDQFGVHAALPMETQFVLRRLVAAVDHDLLKNRSQDPLLDLCRGRRMMPELRKIDGEFKQSVPITVCDLDRSRVQVLQAIFEFAYLPQRRVPAAFEFPGHK